MTKLSDRINELMSVYTDNGWKEFIFTNNGIPIPFNSNWKSIGFNISGGADSALLFYTIAEHLVKHNLTHIKLHTVSHIRCWNTRPWQRYVRLTVIQELKKRFPQLDITEHENYIAPEIEYGPIGPIIPFGNRLQSGDQISNRSFGEFIGYVHKLDGFYCATTSNPDIFADKSYGGASDRNLENKPVDYKNIVYGKITHVKPFLFITKDHVMSDYFSKELTGLLDITRSCEGSIGDDPIKQFIPTLNEYHDGKYVPLCNTCFWCLERNWAIKENTK